jgi:hypothetical protein
MERILVKTDGVPLFIEELTKDILESGLLELDDGTYRLSGALPPLSIPSTLEGALRARIDRLSSAKDVAQVGAAIGRSFAYGIARAVMCQDDDALRLALDRLVEARLTYQHGAPPDSVYTFKHVLVQETVYESLLGTQRISLHSRIVTVIENQFPDIAEIEPELVAHHCERAELEEKAVQYWLKAGVIAVSRSANLEAISHLHNGLKRLNTMPPDDKRARLELDLQLTLGQALIAARGYTAADTTAAFARAEELVEKIGDAGRRYSALYGIFVGRLIGGHIDAAAETIGRLCELAANGKDDAYLCLVHRLHGSLLFFHGDLPIADEKLQKAIALYGPAQQQKLAFHFGPDTGSAAQIFLAMTEWLRGRPQSAMRTAQNAIANARLLENALTLGQVQALAAQLHYDVARLRGHASAQQTGQGQLRAGRHSVFRCDLSIVSDLVAGLALQSGRLHRGVPPQPCDRLACFTPCWRSFSSQQAPRRKLPKWRKPPSPKLLSTANGGGLRKSTARLGTAGGLTQFRRGRGGKLLPSCYLRGAPLRRVDAGASRRNEPGRHDGQPGRRERGAARGGADLRAIQRRLRQCRSSRRPGVYRRETSKPADGVRFMR